MARRTCCLPVKNRDRLASDEGPLWIESARSQYVQSASERSKHTELDRGLKTVAVDSGLPLSLEPGWRVKSLSDEHTVLVGEAGTPPLGLGTRAKLLSGKCNPTVDLHDWIVAVRAGIVKDVWAVDAHGALF